MKRILIAIIAVLMLVAFSGCSSESIQADEVGLHYKGGAFTSSKFANCMESSERSFDGPGDDHYVYPKGQRTFSFTGKDGSETDPIPVVTGSQEVYVPGFVTFSLNTDCKVLRDFHEKVGKKYEAYKDGDDGKGWGKFLNDYIFVPLDATLNDAAGSIELPENVSPDQAWYLLYTDADVRREFEDYVKKNLPDEIEQTLGEQYITVNEVSISKPTISGELKGSLEAKEKARLDNEAQREKNAQVRTQYDTIKDCLDTGLSEQNCTLIFLEQSGADIPFLPVPQGGAVNYQSVQ